jgi:20S proteasome subunit beta 1
MNNRFLCYKLLLLNCFIFNRVQLGEAPLVKTAASVFQELCYNYRDQLTAGIICAGWDRRHGGQVR